MEEYLPIEKLPMILRRVYTLTAVCVGFVIFRSDSVCQAAGIIKTMFMGLKGMETGMALVWNQLTPLFLFTVTAGIIGMFPVIGKITEKAKDYQYAEFVLAVFSYAGSIVVLLASMMSLAGGTYNPFIYFRF